MVMTKKNGAPGGQAYREAASGQRMEAADLERGSSAGRSGSLNVARICHHLLTHSIHLQQQSRCSQFSHIDASIRHRGKEDIKYHVIWPANYPHDIIRIKETKHLVHAFNLAHFQVDKPLGQLSLFGLKLRCPLLCRFLLI